MASGRLEGVRMLVVATIMVFSSGICAASERAAVQVTQPIGGTGNDVVLGQVLYVDGGWDAT